MKLELGKISIVKEEEYLAVFFQDENEMNYFQIQDAYEYDHQDISLNMNSYYIERDDQLFGMYGGIEQIVLHKDRLLISFNDSVKEVLKIENIEIKIDFSVHSNLKEELLCLIRKHEITSNIIL